MPKKLTINIDEAVHKRFDNFVDDSASLSKFIEGLINSCFARYRKRIPGIFIT